MRGITKLFFSLMMLMMLFALPMAGCDDMEGPPPGEDPGMEQPGEVPME